MVHQIELLRMSGIEEQNDEEEQIELLIFHLKKEIREKSHVPKLIESRIKKLHNLCAFQSNIIDLNVNTPVLEAFQKEFPVKDFQVYETNKSNLFLALEKSQDAIHVRHLAEKIKQNLTDWAECWRSVVLDEVGIEAKISEAPDAVLLFQQLQNLNSQGIKYYHDFTKSQLPRELIKEILRLKSFSNK